MTGNETGLQEKVRPDTGISWSRLLLLAGIAGTVAMVVVAAVLTDVEAAVVAVVFGVSTLLGRRRPRLGAVGIGLVSAITLFFMTTAALANLTGGQGVGAVALPGVLAGLSLVALVAAVATMVLGGRASNPSSIPGRVAMLAGLITAGVVVVAATGAGASAPTADLNLLTENVAFDQTELAAAAGTVSVAVTNRDLFWHTFTIAELGVDLQVPVNGRRVVSFEAAPGTYRYICAIPGHDQAGMVGTLTVG